MKWQLLSSIALLGARLGHACGLKHQPSDGQRNVNPDTQLRLSFNSTPAIGTSGFIRVYDAESAKLVDFIDFSIPVSPTAGATQYQKNIVGGMDFYYWPIIVEGNTAVIFLHNNKLEYGKTYNVTIDPEVLKPAEGFAGIPAERPWTFSTKAHGPAPGTSKVYVNADNSEDFNTLQGALDWAPAYPSQRTEIIIRAGNYTELIFFRWKSRIIIRGEGQNKTRVGYPNNSGFNPPGRQGPSRRPAFSFYSIDDIQLSDFTIINLMSGQAEALLAEGNRVVLDHMTLRGSGDAFTTYGTIYVVDTELIGDWRDTLLGYASVYWLRSLITSPGNLMWARTVQGIHGNVFVNCTMTSKNAEFARLPLNTGGVLDQWPYSEIVLINTRTDGIAPVGWGRIQDYPWDDSNVHYWEYNTMDLNGNPVDVSKRHNISRQLELPRDAQILADYTNPAFVLGGWTPQVISA